MRFVSRNSARVFALAALALPLFTGCEKKEPPKPPPPPAVTVALAGRKTVSVFGEYVGLVDSPRTVEIRARAEGYLKEICFKEGAEVEQGSLMFVLDPDQYDVALKKVKAQLLTAQVTLAQAKNVMDIEVDRANLARDQAALANAKQIAEDARVAVAANAMARSQLDSAEAGLKQALAVVEASKAKLAQSEADYGTRVAQAEANVATAQVAVAEAELNLSYTKISTPLKGRVGMTPLKVGSLVGRNNDPTLLAIVSQVDPIYVTFTVSEREMYELKKLAKDFDGGFKVGMILDDGSVYPQEGTINFTDRTLDSGTGTLKMRAEFPNPEKFLRPGNYAKIRMKLSERVDAMVINERAIGVDQNGSFVMVVDGKNVVEYRPVKTGPKTDGMVVIESGLKADERFIVKGLLRARPGAVVNPTLENASVAVAREPEAGAASVKPQTK